MAKTVSIAKEKKEKEKEKAAPPAAPELVKHPLVTLREQMDRVFDEFMGDWRLPSLTRDFWDFEPFPAPLSRRGMVDVRFDVSESDDAVELTAELPGIDEKDIELTLSDGMLVIKGQKKAETETKERDYYLSERRYGSFMRSMRVPETVDDTRIKASFDKGVLKVSMPKRAEAKAKKKKIAISKS